MADGARFELASFSVNSGVLSPRVLSVNIRATYEMFSARRTC